MSLGPVRVLVAQLPTRGIPRLSRSRASPRPALWVQGLGGTASERITNVSLDSTRARLFLNGTGLGHPGHGAGVRGRPQYGATVVGGGSGAAPRLFATRPARRTGETGAIGRTLCLAQRGQGRRGQSD